MSDMMRLDKFMLNVCVAIVHLLFLFLNYIIIILFINFKTVFFCEFLQESVLNSRGMKLFTCKWIPMNQEPKALIFICHGYAMECSITMNSEYCKLNLHVMALNMLKKIGLSMLRGAFIIIFQAPLFALQRQVLQCMVQIMKAMENQPV